jgi:hypothetical protein
LPVHGIKRIVRNLRRDRRGNHPLAGRAVEFLACDRDALKAVIFRLDGCTGNEQQRTNEDYETGKVFHFDVS